MAMLLDENSNGTCEAGKTEWAGSPDLQPATLVSLPKSLVNRLCDLPPAVETLCDRHELLEKRLNELMSDSSKRVWWNVPCVDPSPRRGPNPRVEKSYPLDLAKEDTFDLHPADDCSDMGTNDCDLNHSSNLESSTSKLESSYSAPATPVLDFDLGEGKESETLSASKRGRRRRMRKPMMATSDVGRVSYPPEELPKTRSMRSYVSKKSTSTQPSTRTQQDEVTSEANEEVVKELQAVAEVVQKTQRRKTGRKRNKLSRRSDLLDEYGDGCSYWLALVVTHPLFDSACAFMILLNSFLIGWSTDWLANHDTEVGYLIVCGHLCSLFFFFELVLRLSLHKMFFFCSEDKFWNVFDLILVLFSIIDFVMETVAVGGDGEGASVGSAMRTIKMLRIVRIFRVFRFFSDLTVLVLMITESFKALMWALIMLSLIIYVFAICFTAGATDYLKNTKDQSRTSATLKLRFGSLSRSVNSLVLSMLNGVSWGEVSGPLEAAGWVLAGLFFFYIFFTMFAVLNIITGVFVDNAVQTASNHRDYLVEKYMEVKENYLEVIRDAFEDMDEDESGTITLEELHNYFREARMRSYFQVLGIDAHDCDRLFHLLDEDHSGAVSIDEFLTGCLRLKGDARSIDVHFLIYESKAILAGINDVLKHFGLQSVGHGYAYDTWMRLSKTRTSLMSNAIVSTTSERQ